MKNIAFHHLASAVLTALVISALPATAATPIAVRWSALCSTADNRLLTVTTVDRKRVEGYCLYVHGNELQLSTANGAVIKVDRSAVLSVEMEAVKELPSASLGRGLGEALKKETDWVFSPAAPVGIVAIPATLAYGAIAAPFCWIGDLVHQKDSGKQEITII